MTESFWKRAEEVLHYLWDPIGVSEAPDARDEYQGFLPRVYELLKSEAGAVSIAECLMIIETEELGLRGNHSRAMKVAEVLTDLREWIAKREPWQSGVAGPACAAWIGGCTRRSKA